MPDAEFIAILRNMKVPAGLPQSRALVDYLIEQAELDEPTKTPEEAIAALSQRLGLMTGSGYCH